MREDCDISTNHFEEIRKILGKKYVRSNVESSYDFIELATEGLNANAIKNFRTYYDLSLDTTAQMLNVSEPSIYRWTKANKNLERNLSIKLFEITDLFVHGTEVFGSKDNFFKWLNLPNPSLGGMLPQELIEIPEGISKINNILGRIEHGVYS